MTRELGDKLRAFVAGGGHLVVTAANARGLLPELAVYGSEVAGPRPAAATAWSDGEKEAEVLIDAGAMISWNDGTEEVEDHAFALYRAALPAGTEVMATCGQLPCVVRVAHGAGQVTLLLSPFGLPTKAQHSGPIENAEEKPLACPFELLRHVRRALARGVRRRTALHRRRRPRLHHLPPGRGRLPAGPLQQRAARPPLAHRLALRNDPLGAGSWSWTGPSRARSASGPRTTTAAPPAAATRTPSAAATSACSRCPWRSRG